MDEPRVGRGDMMPDDPLAIKYRIQRSDLVRAYFYNLRHSGRTRLVVLGICLAALVWFLLLDLVSKGGLSINALIRDILLALLFFLVVPIMLYVRARTQERTLSIGPEGIATSIGRQQGTIPWQKIESITETPERIVITGKNANAFTIPVSAFDGDEERRDFMVRAKRYHEAAIYHGPQAE